MSLPMTHLIFPFKSKIFFLNKILFDHFKKKITGFTVSFKNLYTRIAALKTTDLCYLNELTSKQRWQLRWS